jgi:glutamate decarboxylase
VAEDRAGPGGASRALIGDGGGTLPRMALHARSDAGESLDDDLYAAADLAAPVPKFRFPRHEIPAPQAAALVDDQLVLDGNARLNLATFCTTWVEPQVTDILARHFDKNMVDKDEYPQTAQIEERCVRMLADLWHAPDERDSIGTSTTGSSEAAMLGGLAAKWRWRQARQAAGLDTSRPNFVCGSVQICWEKFARYFDVEIRQVPMAPGVFTLTPEQVVEQCDENTIAVVVTFGQTYTGLYEPVAAISAALDDLQARTGLDVPLHVDAASGGFLAPFVRPDLRWDFRLPRVKSINASGHKTGLAPIGVGWAIWRDRSDLPDDLVFSVSYLGGDSPTFNLNYSRPAAQVIAQYYEFLRLGRAGYRRVQGRLYESAAAIAAAVAALGPFELIYDGDPDRGIAAVSWRLREDAQVDGRAVPWNLYDLADRMRTRGWLVPAYSLPPHQDGVSIQRVLLRHGFGRDLADVFIGDLRRAVEALTQHPPAVPMTEVEAGTSSHTGKASVR